MNYPVAADPAVEEYQRNGFAVFPGVFDVDTIAEVRRHVEWLQQRYPGLRPEHLHHPLMRDDAFWVRTVTDDRLLDIVERFLGPDLACFTSHYICKPPGDGQAVLWHQDGSYWSLEPMDALTVWLAIDDTDPENGCLRMIPGSHRRELAPVVMRNDVPNMLCSSVDPALFDVGEAVDVRLRAGDVSVHHPRIIHGSEANGSARRRCGLDIGYIRTSTRISSAGVYINPLLVRGSAAPGINRYRRWPELDPSRSVEFRGCEHWNERVRELNRRPGVVESPVDEPGVTELTAHVIERLHAGTMKAAQVAG